MKTLILSLTSFACFAQSPAEQKIITFSKGEAFTEKEWQDYKKQVYPLVREFFKRDSSHNKFLSNTVMPNLASNDSIESYTVTLEGVYLKIRQKRKK